MTKKEGHKTVMNALSGMTGHHPRMFLSGIQSFMLIFKISIKTWMPAFAGMTFFLIGLSSTVFAKPYAFPVPYNQSDPPPDNVIRFNDLPANGTIKIYTISGELVRDIDFENPPPLPYWDLKNSSGKTVASGVYLFIVEGDGENFVGKLVVIR